MKKSTRFPFLLIVILQLKQCTVDGESSDSLNAARVAALKRHNELRSQHGAPGLILNSTLNDDAQTWAETMLKTGNFGHGGNNGAGQNIYASGGKLNDLTKEAVTATNLFYHEICDYKWNVDEDKNNFLKVGHFTQVVWESSTQLGVGIASGNKGYIAMHYSPPGNYGGQYKKNVKPALNPEQVGKDEKCPVGAANTVAETSFKVLLLALVIMQYLLGSNGYF